MDSQKIDAEQLLAQGPWLRGLARSLVRDESAADDLVQETWLAALRTPPRDAGALRGWLGQVVRNFAINRNRGDTRRQRRENEIAGTESTDPSTDLVEQMELHRTVVDAVLALNEPNREAIILRYFRDLTPSAIAAQLDVPVKTIKTRLHRGLHELRRSLDREYGSRERWGLIACPIAGLTKSALTTTAGAASTFSIIHTIGGVTMAWKVSAALLLVAVLVWVGWPDPESVIEGPAVAASDADGESPTGGGAAHGSADHSPARGGTTAEIAPMIEVDPFRGRVTDASNGQPVVGARVAWIGEWSQESPAWRFDHANGTSIEVRTPVDLLVDDVELQAPFTESAGVEVLAEVVSDDDGAFALPPRPVTARFLRVLHTDYQYRWTNNTGSDPRAECDVRLDSRLTLRAQFVTEDGHAPHTHTSLPFGHVYATVVAGSQELRWMRPMQLDANGVLTMDLPITDKATISVVAASFQYAVQEVAAPFNDTTIELTLVHHDFVGGVVVDPVGNPVPGAEAVLFDRSRSSPERVGTVAQCGRDGRFRVNVRESEVFVAFSAPGFEGREFDGFELNRDDRRIVLQPARVGSIRGHVYEADGRPARSVSVELYDKSGVSSERHVHQTDETGSFQFEPVTPATYQAALWRVDEDGDRTLAVDLDGAVIVVGPGEAVVASIAYKRGRGSVLGTIETPEAGPAADQYVFLKRTRFLRSPESVGLAMSNKAGRFAFEGVLPGRYVVEVGLGGSTSEFVDVVADETAEVHFGRDSQRLALRLFRDEEPVTGGRIFAGRFDGTQALTDIRQGRTGVTGSTSRLMYREGTYLFRAEDSEGGAFIGSFSVSGDDDRDQRDIVWPSNTVTVHSAENATVSVDLIEREGIALENSVPLRLRRVATGSTDSGSFTVRGVGVGGYRITVTTENETRSRRVSIGVADTSLTVDSTWNTE